MTDWRTLWYFSATDWLNLQFFSMSDWQTSEFLSVNDWRNPQIFAASDWHNFFQGLIDKFRNIFQCPIYEICDIFLQLTDEIHSFCSEWLTKFTICVCHDCLKKFTFFFWPWLLKGIRKFSVVTEWRNLPFLSNTNQ